MEIRVSPDILSLHCKNALGLFFHPHHDHCRQPRWHFQCRHVLGNGTLLFPPFPPQDYDSRLHQQEYRWSPPSPSPSPSPLSRCVVRNSEGAIVSRQARLRAVIWNEYQVTNIILSSYIHIIISPNLLFPYKEQIWSGVRLQCVCRAWQCGRSSVRCTCLCQG